jgi:4-hydroxyphenylpyruvate dioxygenase
MTDQFDNPMGTDGFEFVEFATPDPDRLGRYFERLGFRRVGVHRSKAVFLYRQGGVNFILNASSESRAAPFAEQHGPSACSMAFRVKDAAMAYRRALGMGAKPREDRIGPMEINIPAIEGIGGSGIYFVDRYQPENASIYDIDFIPTDNVSGFHHDGDGLREIDHVTHNVYRGKMDEWSDFYKRFFNFREIRYFDIEGKLTGLKSRAMTSPCGKIRIPINESSDDKSQIAEYLAEYKGEGIQHIALSTGDIYTAVEAARERGVAFQSAPDTYFECIDSRILGHGENVGRLRRNQILIDGSLEQGTLLQIFTQNAVGPIFFEIIQRKGNEGFGEGNFKALFESIEADQIRRGVLNG